MRWIAWAIVATLCVGCKTTPQPSPDGPPKMLDAAVVPLCSLDAKLPVTTDVCDPPAVGPAGRPCVKCPAARDCLDTVDMVWCVADCKACKPDTGTLP